MKQAAGKIFDELNFIENEHTFFNSFFIEGNDDISFLQNIPHIVNAPGLCICIEGDADITVGSRNYYLKKGDMCVVLPRTVLHVSKRSPDFRGYVCTCTPEFLFSINMPSGAPLYLFVKNNPCISLTEKERTELIRICNFLEQNDIRKNHPCREEISKALASAVIYEVVGLYKKGKILEQRPFTRKNKYFYEFNKLLTENYHRHRSVSFYADKLCITSRYLSEICKETIGMTATECINHQIMTNARLLLASTDMSILQISDKLNFPNPSFFSQFFKKHESVSPKVYRINNSFSIDE